MLTEFGSRCESAVALRRRLDAGGPSRAAPTPRDPSPQEQLAKSGLLAGSRRKAARPAPASSASSARDTSSSTCFDRSGSMGGSGRNPLRAVKAELLRKPQKPRYRPPVPDHLLQRAAGALQSHRHARPAGLRHGAEQAAGDALPRFDLGRRRHGPRGCPAAGHPAAARRDLLPHRRRRPETLAGRNWRRFGTWRRASSSTPSSSAPARSRPARVFWPSLARQNGGGYAYVDVSRLATWQARE